MSERIAAHDLTGVARQIAEALTRRSETVAVAETAAGGLISAALLALPGASAWFLGGAVAYSAAAKVAWLALPPDAFGAAGVVSETGAMAMARAVRDRVGATWGLAEVGIAGPQTGRRSSKPAGLAYLAVTGREDAAQVIRTGHDDRTGNQTAFARAALTLLARTLSGAVGGG
jgi:PncC family amidohydrolase